MFIIGCCYFMSAVITGNDLAIISANVWFAASLIYGKTE
jgi:hypothetical protein